MSTDRIEKKKLLKAPRSRVWRALTDHEQFGTWFGIDIASGPFRPGEAIKGKIVPTRVDATVATAQKPYEGKSWDATVDRIEPERLFSLRWHPFAVDASVDYAKEPTTLIEFTLEEVPEGTMLTIVESGFDRIPIERRAKAFAANDGGWTMVMGLVEKYVTAS
ncbi:MAG TPA: SRPBCC family protein [Labilithrix sp.]|jgi:uncharacterized protein YndB with AHSA1/START domain